MDQRPFEGINVLDFSWAGVAPLSVNYLSFYGATVVKVESHERPDPLRTLAPFRDGIPSPERSYHFAYTQMSKRYSITLDLEHPKGLDLIKKDGCGVPVIFIDGIKNVLGHGTGRAQHSQHLLAGRG